MGEATKDVFTVTFCRKILRLIILLRNTVQPVHGENIAIDDSYNNKMEIREQEDIENHPKQMSQKTESSVTVEYTNDNYIATKSDSTVRCLWTEFRDNTTMHGVRNVRMGYKYRLRWIIWIIAWLGMGSLLIHNMYKLFTYYSTNPTVNQVKVKFVNEMVFPAITICNLSPYKKSTLSPSMKTYTLREASRIGWLYPPINFSDPALADLNEQPTTEWFNNSTFTVNDMFLYCKMGLIMDDCHQMLTETITRMGKCFTYNSLNKTKQEGRTKESRTGAKTALTFVLDVKQDEYVYNINIAAGIKVVLHEPDEEPDVSNRGFIVTPGMATYVSMKKTEYKYIPAPYKAGGDRYCVDTKAPGFVNPLKYYPEYSRSACLLECKRNYIVGKCGCQDITDPGDELYCSFKELSTCYKHYEDNFDTVSGPKDQCNCQISCEYTDYDYFLSSAVAADNFLPLLAELGFLNIKKDKIEVFFFYDTLSFVSVESFPEYNAEDIIGIIGGQMGIFLGASLLTLSELLEFIILSLTVLVKNCYSYLKQKCL